MPVTVPVIVAVPFSLSTTLVIIGMITSVETLTVLVTVIALFPAVSVASYETV